MGAFGNSTAARTSTENNTSSSTPTFTGAQSQVQSTLGSTLENELANGPNLTPELTQGTDQINKTYQGAGDQITQQEAARGFGQSGAVGSGLQSVALARAGAIGGLQNNLDVMAQQQQNTITGQAENFGFASPGKNSTSDTTKVAAGSGLAGGLQGAVSGYTQQANSFSSLLNALSSGGSASPGGGGNVPLGTQDT